MALIDLCPVVRAIEINVVRKWKTGRVGLLVMTNDRKDMAACLFQEKSGADHQTENDQSGSTVIPFAQERHIETEEDKISYRTSINLNGWNGALKMWIIH